MKSKGFLQRIFDMNASVVAKLTASIEKEMQKHEALVVRDPDGEDFLNGLKALAIGGRVIRKGMLMVPFLYAQKATLAVAKKTGRTVTVTPVPKL